MEAKEITNVNVADVTLENAVQPTSSPELFGVSTELVEKIKDMKSLTKEELIKLNEQLVEQVKVMSEEIAHHADEKNKLVSDINGHYKQVLNVKNRYIKYLTKKLSLIVNIINIDEYEEKEEN